MLKNIVVSYMFLNMFVITCNCKKCAETHGVIFFHLPHTQKTKHIM
jgi:hypothetical protein